MLQAETILYLIQQLWGRASAFLWCVVIVEHGCSYWTSWLICINSLSLDPRLPDMSGNLLFRHVTAIR